MEMVRTFANFVWDVHVPEGDEPPLAKAEVASFVNSLVSAGLNPTPLVDHGYAWGFSCTLPHLSMDCLFGLVGGEPSRWLLACSPRRGWFDWCRGRWHEDEQRHFARIVDESLRTDPRVSDLVWFTQDEWDRSPR